MRKFDSKRNKEKFEPKRKNVCQKVKQNEVKNIFLDSRFEAKRFLFSFVSFRKKYTVRTENGRP